MEGNFGKVYSLPFTDKEIVIKSYSLKKSINAKTIDLLHSSRLEDVLKEYCIAKISSCLECGPLMNRPLGFDILIFNNRI